MEERLKRLDRNNVEDILALTPMQEGMLYQYLLNPNCEQYFEQTGYYLIGHINEDLVKKAWEFVVETNEMMRTVYRWQGLSKPVQVVLRNLHIPFLIFDFSEIEHSEKCRLVEEIKSKDRSEKVDISLQTFRITLCKLSKNEYEMVISNHHIIYDGWSNVILLKEFLEAYESYYYGIEPKRIIKNKYKEFIKWIKSRDKKKQKDYWGEYLHGFKLNSPFLSNKKRLQGNNIEKYFEYIIQQDLKEKIRKFTREKEVTLAALLYGSWGILLHKYGSINDIVFGTTVSGRNTHIKGIENMVGLFINTLPLRIKINSEDSVMRLLMDINDNLLEREEYEDTSLTDIITFSGLDRNDRIFDSVVVIQNYPLDEKLYRKNGIINISLSTRFYMTKIDLTLGVRAFDNIILDFTYDTGVFNEDTIKGLSQAFVSIIEKIVEELDRTAEGLKVKHIGIVDKHEKMQLLSGISNNQKRIMEMEEVDFDEVF